ncbi:MAG: hypothetical protein ABIG61_15950 [Planctomycetota bacterium]
MNWMKWLRKKKGKLIAIVGGLLMVSFLGIGSLGRLGREGVSAKKVIAYYGSEGQITAGQLLGVSQKQLRILQILQADRLLRSQRDLGPILLSELLFTDPKTSVVINYQIKQIIGRAGLKISKTEIDSFFEQVRGRNDLYWMLLKVEAERAGIEIPNAAVRKQLTDMMPTLTGGYTYAQVVQSVIKSQNVTEEEILEAFGDLLAVLTYAHRITKTEDVTSSELMHIARREMEKLNAEMVRIEASLFVKDQAEPSEAAIKEQFEKYKDNLPGQISQSNPYGFGYKLLPTAQLEYIAIKLDDILKTVNRPTDEEAEEYYQGNSEKFIYQVPLDPNDPNSETVQKTKTYAEVADTILEKLLDDRIRAKADAMLGEAKRVTESGYIEKDVDKLSDEEFIATAGSYEQAAKQLESNYKIRIYHSKTGMLSAGELAGDRYSGMLFVPGRGGLPIGLGRIVFAVKGLEAGKLGPFEYPAPRLYENIGPLKDGREEIVVLSRVTAVDKGGIAADINQQFDKKGILPDETDSQKRPDIYTVKEAVAEDLKKEAAMASAQAAAEKFVKSVEEKSWDDVIDEFNKRYGSEDSNDESKQKPFKIETIEDFGRILNQDIRMLEMYTEGSVAAETVKNDQLVRKNFFETLDSLLGSDSSELKNVPYILEFKPSASYYIVKALERNIFTQDQYERMKGQIAYGRESLESQSLALVYYMPENIVKRLGFRWAGVDKRGTDANNAVQENGGS